MKDELVVNSLQIAVCGGGVAAFGLQPSIVRSRLPVSGGVPASGNTAPGSASRGLTTEFLNLLLFEPARRAPLSAAGGGGRVDLAGRLRQKADVDSASGAPAPYRPAIDPGTSDSSCPKQTRGRPRHQSRQPERRQYQLLNSAARSRSLQPT